MTHLQRLVRAGALASLVVAAGLSFTFPTSAQQLGQETGGSLQADPESAGPTPTAEEPGAPTPAEATTTPDGRASTPSPTPETAAPGSAATETPTHSEVPTSTPTATDLEARRATSTPSPTPSDPIEPRPTQSDTPSDPTLTPSETPSPTPTPGDGPTATPTPSLEAAGFAFAPAASFAPGAVLINEVAWAGTEASTSDEWIELWNPGSEPIDLTGWALRLGNDTRVDLSGEISAYGFYLLERTDDETVADVAADRIYTGALNNAGQRLELLGPAGDLIDTANASGGPWPAGSTSPRRSMERHGVLDVPGSWSTFPGVGGNGIDAAGNPVAGTPRQPNAPAVSTATPTAPAAEATPFPVGAVLINEVAWAGTLASSTDEWIELYNPGSEPVDLAAWILTDDGDIRVELTGGLDPGGLYLLERSDDQTVSDIPADVLYTGSLANSGEPLRLVDPTGTEIDSVNPGGGAWPAGDSDSRASMERGGGWRTFTGYYGLGRDADGAPIRGTPRGPNSIWFPAPTPTWIPGRVVINEILVRPRHDWEGAGGVGTDDEFIELYNRGPGSVNLRGWTLDDAVIGGSRPFDLPAISLEPGEFAVFFRSRTRIALNDTGDSVRLSAPDGSAVDKLRYLRGAAVNLSYGRLPDGRDDLTYGLWPTPGGANRLYTPPGPFPPGAVVISEVAWAGTRASPNDEWIELHNPGHQAVNLYGWQLTDGNDLQAQLFGVVEPGGFYLLERSDDQTISDLQADRIYTGALGNFGESLRLLDPTGSEVDVANPTGGSWPGGDAGLRASMERRRDGWATYSGTGGLSRDAEGNPVQGSPGAPNSTASLTTCGPRAGGAAPCP